MEAKDVFFSVKSDVIIVAGSFFVVSNDYNRKSEKPKTYETYKFSEDLGIESQVGSDALIDSFKYNLGMRISAFGFSLQN